MKSKLNKKEVWAKIAEDFAAMSNEEFQAMLDKSGAEADQAIIDNEYSHRNAIWYAQEPEVYLKHVEKVMSAYRKSPDYCEFCEEKMERFMDPAFGTYYHTDQDLWNRDTIRCYSKRPLKPTEQK